MPVVHTPPRKQWQVREDKGESVRKVLGWEQLQPSAAQHSMDTAFRPRDQAITHQQNSKEPLTWFFDLKKEPGKTEGLGSPRPSPSKPASKKNQQPAPVSPSPRKSKQPPPIRFTQSPTKQHKAPSDHLSLTAALSPPHPLTTSRDPTMLSRQPSLFISSPRISIRHQLLSLLLDAEGHRQQKQKAAADANEELKYADSLCNEIRDLIINHQAKSNAKIKWEGHHQQESRQSRPAPSVHHNPLYDSEHTFLDSEVDWALLDMDGHLRGHYAFKSMR
jgi:hypothetical protein